MSETLYQISERYREILSIEPTSDDEVAALMSALEETNADFKEKVENTVKAIKNYEALAQAIRAEEIRLAERRRSIEKWTDRLVSFIEYGMFVSGQRDLKAGIFELKIIKSPKSISVVNELEIPKEYFKEQAPVLSKTAIWDAHEAGIEVPGVEFIQKERLRIK